MPGRWWWHADGNRCSSAEKEWSRQENTQWNLTRGGYCNKGVRFHWIAGLVVCTTAAGRANEWSSTRNMWCVCVHPYIDEKYFSVTKWLSGELRQFLLHKNPQTDPSTCNQLTHVRYSLHFLTLPYIPQFIHKFQQHNHSFMCSELGPTPPGSYLPYARWLCLFRKTKYVRRTFRGGLGGIQKWRMVVSTADVIAATLVNIGVIRVGVLVFDDSTCPFCVVTE